MISKLRKKFITINMALVTLVLLIFFVALLTFTYSQNKNETIRALEHTLNMGYLPPPKIMPHKSREPFLNIPTFLVSIQGEEIILEGHIFSISDEVVSLALNEALGSKSSSGVISSLNLRFLIDDSGDTYRVAFSDMTNEISALKHLALILAAAGLCVLLIFFFISLHLAVWALRPVEKAWEQQQQFVADASHELKTPLTIILANISILFTKPMETIYNQQKWLKNTQVEALRMKGLVDDLLYLAKSDANQNELNLVETNLSDIVWNSILPFESLAYENGVITDSNIQSDLFILGDENSLKQLIAILIDNAIKYTQKNGKISVSLNQIQNRIILSVNNSGEPIPKECLPHLFNRFYRVDESRKHQQGSYGLGLSIANTIVEKHQAKINVKSDHSEGTTFEITFDKYKPNKIKEHD